MPAGHDWYNYRHDHRRYDITDYEHGYNHIDRNDLYPDRPTDHGFDTSNDAGPANDDSWPTTLGPYDTHGSGLYSLNDERADHDALD